MDESLKDLDNFIKQAKDFNKNIICIRDYLSKNDFVLNCPRKWLCKQCQKHSLNQDHK